MLDFVDSKTRKLVFRGIATGTLGDPKSNAAKIKDAVEKVVADYPRPHGGPVTNLSSVVDPCRYFHNFGETPIFRGLI